ncbi:unnamed protein product [Mytilus edulis]|uniref:Uncharacterized protein n=1 Tax=Mytilus edulis TaxID=6550 RepID=A0A8S3UF98_MYTED|nr:unnamed protein product [Mytilus edulis]
MYLSPLNIFYTNVEHLSEDLLTETDLERKVKSYKDKEQIPKLQVFYKCGRYFTLNNAELRVCRKLQNDGFCHRIKVEKVPVKRIPKGILDTMEVPETDCPITRDTTKRSKTGYRQLTSRDALIPVTTEFQKMANKMNWTQMIGSVLVIIARSQKLKRKKKVFCNLIKKINFIDQNV